MHHRPGSISSRCQQKRQQWGEGRSVERRRVRESVGNFLEFLRWEASGFIFFELVTIGVQRAGQLRGGEGQLGEFS